MKSEAATRQAQPGAGRRLRAERVHVVDLVDLGLRREVAHVALRGADVRAHLREVVEHVARATQLIERAVDRVQDRVHRAVDDAGRS